MKLILTLILALFTLVSFAQNSDVTKAAPDTTKSIVSPTSLSLANERDFYKKMYELAQSNADKAHNDTQWGYGINVTVIVSIIAIILAIQLINTRNEIQRMAQQIANDVENRILRSETDSQNKFNEINSSITLQSFINNKIYFTFDKVALLSRAIHFSSLNDHIPALNRVMEFI
jgi:hypothetical protein